MFNRRVPLVSVSYYKTLFFGSFVVVVGPKREAAGRNPFLSCSRLSAFVDSMHIRCRDSVILRHDTTACLEVVRFTTARDSKFV
jgi:hypothetical protein